MQSSSVPAKFPIPFAASAGSSFIRQVPQASQIGTQNGAASLTDGFPPLCFQPVAAGGSWPWGQDMNGILKQITQWDQWQAAGGPIVWDSAFSTAIGGYPKGALLASSSLKGFWINTIDNNTTNPDVDSTNWDALVTLSEFARIFTAANIGILKHPGGTIWQWCVASAPIGAPITTVFNFPVEFPNSCLGALGSIGGNTPGGVAGGFAIQSISNSQYSVTTNYPGASGVQGMTILAVGF